MFLSHIDIPLPPSLSLPLSLESIEGKKLKKKKNEQKFTRGQKTTAFPAEVSERKTRGLCKRRSLEWI